ncbi:MAG: hypothetical protein NTX64_00235 [Elusimicrobia bacterium]|nr:hypothetical protein [Elusimicrobiota bacterium]
MMLLALAISPLARSQTPLDTEVGDVILREFDYLPVSSSYTYIGHTGIISEWQGYDTSDPANYKVFDMQGTSSTTWNGGVIFTSATITNRTFQEFTLRNFWASLLFDIPRYSYSGGYVRHTGYLSPSGEPMTPDMRHQILLQAQPWVGQTLTSQWFPFTKNAAAKTFRCDGFVEYVYEQAQVGGGDGLWKQFLERYILTPASYLSTIAGVAEREHGTAPSLTVTSIGGGTVSDGAAISSTTITVTAADESTGSGIRRIVLTGPTSYTTDLPSDIQISTTATYPDLADGSYSVVAYDRAGNHASLSFSIDTTAPNLPDPTSRAGDSFPGGNVTGDKCVVLSATDDGSGIQKTWWTGTSGTAGFDPGTSTGSYAPSACEISPGTYAEYAEDWAGNVSSRAIVVSATNLKLTISGSGEGWSDSASGTTDLGIINGSGGYFRADFDGTDCTTFAVTAAGQSLQCVPQCQGCAIYYELNTLGPPNTSFGWSIANVSGNNVNTTVLLTGGGNCSGCHVQITFNAAPHPYTLGMISGTNTVPEVIQTTFTTRIFGSTLTVSSPYSGVGVSTSSVLSDAEYAAMLRQVLRLSSPRIYTAQADGGAAVFDSTMTLTLTYPDSSADTTTLKFYRFRNGAWDSSAITAQSASRSGNIVTVTGQSTQTLVFAAFFAGSDSSAPITTFSLAAGSSRAFDDTVFLSTDALIVLSSTDPVVDGFASQVSTIWYRVDATSGTAPFQIYSGSIPFALGPHVFEYRAQDYAGNFETIHASTFLVTAGQLARFKGDLSINGRFLAGFLDYGATVDIQSQAQNQYTLRVSSPDKSTLLAVDNIGDVTIGPSPASARMTVSPSIFSDAALQLRSGNSTATWSSTQLAFGYNGTAEMRHAIATQHHPSTVDGSENRMDFFLWTPQDSTAAIGSMDVLSLRASTLTASASVHVRPMGIPDVELEVSDGASTGGGTVHRAQAFTPSSRDYKEDIAHLGPKEEDQALQDVLSLRPARFRYKRRARDGTLVNDPTAPLFKGLIYEDAPASIRGQHEDILITERIANLELALKAASRRVESLQTRIRKLKEEH